MHLQGQPSQLIRRRSLVLPLAAGYFVLGPSVLHLLIHEAALSAIDNQVSESASPASLAGVCSRSGFDVVSS